MADADIRLWIGYDEETVEIVDVMAYKGDDFDRIPGATYVEIFPPLHPDAIKLEKHANGTISVVRDDDKWTIIEPRLFKHFRLERARRLVATDFLMVSDFPFPSDTIRQAWITYRQALRDITAINPTLQANGMGDLIVTWPTAPIWPANVV